ncbi:response regulator [Oleiharenicola lentus]|uniref:response regulator n=1 Tax=Oleiharenicola lentus TaxID=2508720 RepID=UPI003F67E414
MNRTILLVEDDDNDVFLFKRALKRLGIMAPVHVASDGQQAIDYLEGIGNFSHGENFPFPHLVLLDLKLPRVKGLDVLKRIRTGQGAQPIIVILSASKNTSDVSSAYELGANAYLAKPPDFESFVTMVSSIASFWLTYNQVRFPEHLNRNKP